MSEFQEKLKQYGLTEDEYSDCIDDIMDKVSGKIDIDWEDIIQRYNLPIARDTLRKASSQEIFGSVAVTQYLLKKRLENQTNKIETEINRYKNETSIDMKNGTTTSDKLIIINGDDLKDPSFLLFAHGFDVAEWELVSARNNIWNVYSKQDGVSELYSSKIVVKPRTEISLLEVGKFYKELVEKYEPPIIKMYEDYSDGYLVELPIFDLHFGKKSTFESVGKEFYNSDIARDCFNYVIDYTINRLKKMNINIDKVIFPIGQDFFHYDNMQGLTTGGTPQDHDLSNKEMFKLGTIMLIDGISKLSKELKTKVEVFCVSGNHDFATSYHSVMSLWAYFNNDENVSVSLNSSPRQYVEYGQNLIGFTHGDKEKKRIKGIMQIESKEAWGRTTFREWHCGHLHSEQTEEDCGIIIRNLPSVTGTDQWHHNSGYVGAIRKTTCFIWSKESGIDSTFNILIK